MEDVLEWRGDGCAMETDVLKSDREHTCVRSLNSVARSVLVSLGVSQPPAEFWRQIQIDDKTVVSPIMASAAACIPIAFRKSAFDLA